MKKTNILITLMTLTTSLSACSNVTMSLKDALIYAEQADRMVNTSHITEIRHTSTINDKQTYHSIIRYDYNNKYYSNELKYTVTEDHPYENYEVGTTIDLIEFTYTYEKVRNISGHIKIVNDHLEEAMLYNKEMAEANYSKYFNNSYVGTFIDHTLEYLLNDDEDNYNKYEFHWSGVQWLRVDYKSNESNNSVWKTTRYLDHNIKIHNEEGTREGVPYTEKIHYDSFIKIIYFHEEYFK